MKAFTIILMIVLGAGLYGYSHGFSFTGSKAARADIPPGLTDILRPPVQKPAAKAIAFDDYTLNAVASYKITARVLSKKNYPAGPEKKLSPVDLALGWGLMADRRVLKDISVSQGGRYYQWRTKDYPIPHDQIARSSANTHIIPASTEIRKQIRRLGKGDVVTLEGYLVNVTQPGGWRWGTSTTRQDTGKGACEILYVESVAVH